jgi:hypothetical protein
MTDGERPRAMDFIVSQQAKNSVELEKLIETHRRAENRLVLTEQRLDRGEYRLDRYERMLKLMVGAGRRERRTRSQADERLTNALAELAEAQKRTEGSIAHTDTKFDALVDIVRQRQNAGS